LLFFRLPWKTAVEESQAGLRWERLGELAAQLAVCAQECDSFLARQLDALESLQQQLSEEHQRNLRPRHPAHDDPVVAAVWNEFAVLRSVLDDVAR
jgi:hypothetical protein